jgi:hypothetical protein
VDTHDWLVAEQLKLRTNRLRGTRYSFTRDEVMKVVETHRAKTLERQLQDERPDGLEETLLEALDASENEAGDTDSSSSQVATARQPHLSLEAPGGGKGASARGRGKGRRGGAGGGGGSKGGPVPAASPPAPLGGGGSKGAPPLLVLAGTPEKLSSNVNQYISALSLSDVLAGKNLAQALYQARERVREIESCLSVCSFGTELGNTHHYKER